jgi:hypothetical protein
MKNSERIKNRLIQCVEEGEISIGDVVEITEYLVNRINITTPSEYAKIKGISRAGVTLRIKRGKEATLKIKGKTFIIN